MDCSQANNYISDCIYLLKEIDRLYWIYPFVWGIVLARKIFYA
jgi:hypothetical protein